MTEKRLRQLTLALIVATAWEEDPRYKYMPPEKAKKIFKSWKGYSFEILNELEQAGYIRNLGKVVIVSAAGQDEGRQLLEKIEEVLKDE